jgi:hypothetical protein
MQQPTSIQPYRLRPGLLHRVYLIWLDVAKCQASPGRSAW